jgi:hypothetical protein
MRSGRLLRLALYLMATVQLAGCYFTLVRPYVNTALYESGKERVPFQTRVLMMAPMWWAHRSGMAAAFASYLAHSKFWYLRPPEPEAIVQLWINVASLLVAGWVATQIYRAAACKAEAPREFLAFLVYPLFLVLCACHYILHTIQNFRFIYDLPGVAFFSVGLWLIYFRKSPWLFASLFALATLNRETTLLLLPFYMLSAASRNGVFRWRNAFNPLTLSVVISHIQTQRLRILPAPLAQSLHAGAPEILAAIAERGRLPAAVHPAGAPLHPRSAASRLAVGAAGVVWFHVFLGNSRRNPSLRRVVGVSHLCRCADR